MGWIPAELVSTCDPGELMDTMREHSRGQSISVATRRPPPETSGVTPLHVLTALQRTAGNAAVCGLLLPSASVHQPVDPRAMRTAHGSIDPILRTASVQRDGQTTPKAGTVPSRGAVENLRNRATGLQDQIGSFIGIGKGQVAQIRSFWAQLNGAYERVYGHYTMVLSQGAAAARKEEVVANVLIGTGLGIFADITLPATLVNAAVRQVLSEVSPNIAQVPMQFKAGGSDAAPLPDQLPAFKQLQTVSKLDELQSILLQVADPAPQLLGSLALAAERLIGETRVAQAGGRREMSDAQVKQDYDRLEGALSKLAAIDEPLRQAQSKFDLLGKTFSGLTIPTDREAEQDIWIEWIVAQGSPPYALNNRVIANHLRDIELSGGASDLPYGRLKVNFGHWITVYDLDDAYNGASQELPGVQRHWQRLLGATNE